MIIHTEPHRPQPRPGLMPTVTFHRPVRCLVANCSAQTMYQRELERHHATEAKLRRSLIHRRALLRQKDDLLRQNEVLSKESEHRLLNGLQLIASLLSMQSRTTNNAEAAAQMTIAANRVAAIGRVHRHLHALDNVESVEFKRYLEGLCRDLAGMALNEGPSSSLVVEGIEVRLPTATAIPLGFIASELMTNALKYASGKIAVTLQKNAGGGFLLSVSDDGPGLPEGFDPAGKHGLGMKLISSLVRRINGQLHIERGENGKGARFVVMFS